MKPWWALLVACMACGDDRTVPSILEPHGGSRLAVQWYRFDDGTEQPEALEMYDLELHTKCSVQTWIDGALRCVPVADDAIYTDAACTMLVGLAQTIEKPSHFVNTAVVGSDRVPARVFRAGAQIAGISMFYENANGMCEGPYAVDPEDPIYELGDEIDGATLPVIVDSEVGAGRLGMAIHTSDGGMLVPFGAVDRDLALACNPTPLPDGNVRCDPPAPVADAFADASCNVPAIVVPVASPPALAKVADPVTCTTYRRIGNELATPVYRRVGDACRRDTAMSEHVFSLGDAIDLPALSREIERRDDRRLQRIVDAGDDLRFFDDRLFDAAIGADCRRAKIGDVTRCIPADLAPAQTLFTAGCAIAVPVAVLPRDGCRRPAFATAITDAGIELRAIGEPPTQPLFQLADACTPYQPPSNSELHVLGPPLAPETFSGAIYYGAR